MAIFLDVKEWSGPFFDAHHLGIMLNFEVDVKILLSTSKCRRPCAWIRISCSKRSEIAVAFCMEFWPQGGGMFSAAQLMKNTKPPVV